MAQFSDLTTGLKFPEISLEIDREALVRYAGAADDYVRQHWDHPFMVEHGFPDVVVHGWLGFAHMCRVITNFVGPAEASIAMFSVRYVQPAYPGLFRCGGDVAMASPDEARVELWARNSEDAIITKAQFRLIPVV